MKKRSHHASCTLLATIAVFTLISSSARSADWFKVQSNDKKVSVEFPHKAEKFEVVVADSPAGKVKTEVVKHQGEGIMLTISDSPIPGLALAFASKDKILEGGAAGVVAQAYAKEISSKKTKIDGAPGLVLRYEAADFTKAEHPGYTGLAVLFVVDGHLYIINSVLTKEDATNNAIQERLLNSIKVSK